MTKYYIKLLVASQMGQGIMPNTAKERQGISFLKLSGKPDPVFELYPVHAYVIVSWCVCMKE